MIINVKKTLADAVGRKHFKSFELGDDSWQYSDSEEIDLKKFDTNKILNLKEILSRHIYVHGTSVLIKDISTWLYALNDPASAKARTVKNFSELLVQYISKVPGHRIYEKHGDDQWLCYYVNEIEYNPVQKHNYHTTPAHVTMQIIHEEFGGMFKRNIEFLESDCRGISVSEALIRKALVAENEELRANYINEVNTFIETVKLIGKQYLCIGTAVDDLDGNSKRENSWWGSRTNTIQMVRGGNPTKCVIDVFYEDDKTKRDDHRKVHIDRYFWKEFIKKDHEDDDCEEQDEIEIPIHPFCAIFDLSKHLRLRTHVNYLTPYTYDKSISEKLVIPNEIQSLVHILVQHRDGGFKDIIKGKSGGAVVLLCGRPGVGKTLTAEVFAEAEERALYSIQCSQLGTDPDTLEDELLKIFSRGQRWNAVMLLDEADVYVRSRGEDLTQNAIVGVFLRVLEYQSSILFLTTNRPENVDDAIASRCIAKIEYKSPTPIDQKRIWRVLADNAKISITDQDINEIVEKNSGLSGRDIKNLMKLASLVRPGQKICSETIDYVRKFKPVGCDPSENP